MEEESGVLYIAICLEVFSCFFFSKVQNKVTDVLPVKLYSPYPENCGCNAIQLWYKNIYSEITIKQKKEKLN